MARRDLPIGPAVRRGKFYTMHSRFTGDRFCMEEMKMMEKID